MNTFQGPKLSSRVLPLDFLLGCPLNFGLSERYRRDTVNSSRWHHRHYAGDNFTSAITPISITHIHIRESYSVDILPYTYVIFASLQTLKFSGKIGAANESQCGSH